MRKHHSMRTTLDISDDVLLAAKERARREQKTMGEVVSELLRQALTAPMSGAVREGKPVYGFQPFGRRGAVVSNDLIDRLRNEDAY